MDRESVERLRFDRRLQRRSGWVTRDEVAEHEKALVDVSAKMTTAAEIEAEETKEAEKTEAAAPPPAQFGAPKRAPVAGDFSSSPSFSSSGRTEPAPAAPSGIGGGFGNDPDGSQGA